MENPLKYFAELRDPRVERNREHLLEEILLISIAAVLSGAESWNDIAEYGEDKLEWLKTFLTLPSGIPSHDTFNRVFAALDPEEMEKGFVAWVSSIAKLTAGEVVAIDGKALCGTRESGKKTLVHMVSAWAEGNGLVLAQRKVDEKSNEITAIPKLLNALELTGTVVTIDAMGCQRGIARQIVAKKADYVLAVKENQGLLAEQVKDSFLTVGLRRSGRGNRLWPRTGRATQVLGDGRSWPDRKGIRMGLFTGVGAYRVGTVPQGHGQNRARDPLLHHQPQPRCGAAELA